MSDATKPAERTAAEAARAAPVTLPAGSYDSAALQKDLDAAAAKGGDKRQELVDKALDTHNETKPEAAPEPAPEPAPTPPAAPAAQKPE